MSDWIRLHKPPKYCRGFWSARERKLDAKADYLYNKSYGRFMKNPVNIRNMSLLDESFKTGRIGIIEGFRFIES